MNLRLDLAITAATAAGAMGLGSLVLAPSRCVAPRHLASARLMQQPTKPRQAPKRATREPLTIQPWQLNQTGQLPGT